MAKSYFTLLPRELRESLLYYVEYKILLELYEFAEFSSILNGENFWKKKALQAGSLRDWYETSQTWKIVYKDPNMNPRYLYLIMLYLIPYIESYGVIDYAVHFEDLDAIIYFVGNKKYNMTEALDATITQRKSKLFHKLWELYKYRLNSLQSHDILFRA